MRVQTGSTGANGSGAKERSATASMPGLAHAAGVEGLGFPAARSVGMPGGNRAPAYVLALTAVALAIALRLLLQSALGDQFLFVMLIAAIAFSAWYGGRGCGIAALLAGAVGTTLVIPDARHAFAAADPVYQLGLVLYGLTGYACITLIDSLRSARQAAEQMRYEKDRAIAQRLACESDLTSRAEHLQAADRRKNEFLALLAHELRNSLAAIRSAAQLLKMKAVPGAEWSQQVIERQVQQMARLLDDLLDVERINNNILELRRERVALAEVVQRAMETSRPSIDAGGHALDVELPAEPLYLEADPMRLAQVLSNLLNNAAKYTPDGGRIRLSAVRAGDEVVVSVEDNGMGVAPDMLPYVFERFTQAESLRGRSQGGLGIGLSLVKGLTEMHGGRVEAYSEGVGKGAVFRVILPAKE